MKVERVRASVVCVSAGRLLAVRLADPATGLVEVYLPGGALEAGEALVAAAEREALEETGYRVRVEAASERVLTYPFLWGGVERVCRTHFFRAALADNAPPVAPSDDPQLNRGTVWIEVAAVPGRFGYHAGILAEILALV